MKFTKDLVDNYANNLLIGLTDEENEMVLKEFNVIDNDINIINTIEGINEIEPMTYCLDSNLDKLREDIATETPSIDDLLSNTKKKIGREIEVPKVVE